MKSGQSFICYCIIIIFIIMAVLVLKFVLCLQYCDKEKTFLYKTAGVTTTVCDVLCSFYVLRG